MSSVKPCEYTVSLSPPPCYEPECNCANCPYFSTCKKRKGIQIPWYLIPQPTPQPYYAPGITWMFSTTQL